jgi:hypothetical protein
MSDGLPDKLRQLIGEIESIDNTSIGTEWAEILEVAAKDLADWEWLRAHHHDIDAPILVCYDADKHESLEAAIDAARKAGEEGVPSETCSGVSDGVKR